MGKKLLLTVGCFDPETYCSTDRLTNYQTTQPPDIFIMRFVEIILVWFLYCGFNSVSTIKILFPIYQFKMCEVYEDTRKTKQLSSIFGRSINTQLLECKIWCFLVIGNNQSESKPWNWIINASASGIKIYKGNLSQPTIICVYLGPFREVFKNFCLFISLCQMSPRFHFYFFGHVCVDNMQSKHYSCFFIGEGRNQGTASRFAHIL